MYLGKIENRACHIGNAAPNSSIILTGLSGSGKSCRQNQIELEAVKQGNTVIVIDASQNHLKPYIFSDIRAEYCRHTNRIKVATDGLGFRLFAPVRDTANAEEPFPALVNANVQTFRAALSLGSKQTAILREAIIEAVKLQAHQPVLNDAQVLSKAFENHQDNSDWCSVYQKLWTLLHYNVLRSERQHLQKQAINIFDLAGMDTLSSDSLAEVILAYIWRCTFHGVFGHEHGNIVLSIDEFQHCKTGKDSTLRTILREGRRFGLSLILTTQTLGIFSPEEISMLNQAAVHLYFRPAPNEARSIARQIDASKSAYWQKQLLTLQRGNCIATGFLQINGHDIYRPLKLS